MIFQLTSLQIILNKKIQTTETQRLTNTPANQQSVSDTKVPQDPENVKDDILLQMIHRFAKARFSSASKNASL